MCDGDSLASESHAPSVDFKTVKKGSKGKWVRKLQEALEIQIDGKFGNDTETVLEAWQQDHGLEVDGIAGCNAYRVLGLSA